MSHRDGLVGLFIAGGVLILALPSRAQEPADAERARVAESILRRAEEGTRRAFDPAFRRTALLRLAALSVEELSARESRGASQGIGPLALGDSNTQLLYTPVAPCRIVDTRLAGGSLAAGSARDIRVSGTGLGAQGGNPAGCNVPHGPATSAIINFVAVNPVGPGNLRAWAYSEPPLVPPTASILNYPFGLTLANGIAVPLCDVTQTTCSFDLKVQADVNGAHLVADVVGYFERFPKEQVRSFTVRGSTGSQTTIGAACTHVTGAQVMLTVPAAGKVTIRAVAPITIGHIVQIDDVLQAGIGQSPTDCAFGNQGIGRFSVPSPIVSANWDATVPTFGVFDVAPGSYTFYLNAFMFVGGGGNDIVIGQQSAIEATFYPN